MRPISSLNGSLLNQQKKKDDDLFLSKIVYPQSLLNCQYDALLIGWNIDSFDCVIAFYIGMPNSFVGLREIDLALEKAYYSEYFSLSNYQNFSTPPKVLGEWRPKLDPNYMPHNNLRESMLWLTLTKKNIINMNYYNANDNPSSESNGTNINININISNKSHYYPYLYKAFSLSSPYNPHVYMISYEDIDSDNFFIYNLPSLTDILLISSISPSSSSSSSFSNSPSENNFLSNLNDWRFFSLSNLPLPPSSLVSSLKFNYYLNNNYSSLNFYEKFYSLVPFTLNHLTNFLTTSSNLTQLNLTHPSSNSYSPAATSSSASSNSSSSSLLSQLSNFSFSKLHRILSYINSSNDLKRIFTYYYESSSMKQTNTEQNYHNSKESYSSAMHQSIFPLSFIVFPFLKLIFNISHFGMNILSTPYKALIWLHYLTLQGYFRSSHSTSSSSLKKKKESSNYSFFSAYSSSNPSPTSTSSKSDTSNPIADSTLLRSKYYFLANYSNYLYELSILLHNIFHLYQLILFFSIPKYHTNIRKLLYRNYMNILLRFVFHYAIGSIVLYYLLTKYKENVIEYFSIFFNYFINFVIKIPLNYLIKQNNLSLNFIITYKVGVILLNIIKVYNRIVMFVIRHMNIVLILFNFFSFFNIILFLSLLLDFFNIIFFPITIIYWILCLQYRLHLDMISTLWLLFKGKKKNILRLRIDSSEFNHYQLLFSMILYTIMIFSLPNFIIFYYLFSLFKLFIIFFNFVLWKLKHFLSNLKVYDLFLYFVNKKLLIEDSSINFSFISSTSLFNSLVDDSEFSNQSKKSQKRKNSSTDKEFDSSFSFDNISYLSNKRKNSIGKSNLNLESIQHSSQTFNKINNRQNNLQTQFKLNFNKIRFPIKIDLFFSIPLILLLLENIIIGQYLSLGLSSYSLRLRAHDLAKEYYLISHLVTFLLQENIKPSSSFDSFNDNYNFRFNGYNNQHYDDNIPLLSKETNKGMVKETYIKIMKMSFYFDDFLFLLPSLNELKSLEIFFPSHLYYVKKLIWLIIFINFILFLSFFSSLIFSFIKIYSYFP